MIVKWSSDIYVLRGYCREKRAKEYTRLLSSKLFCLRVSAFSWRDWTSVGLFFLGGGKFYLDCSRFFGGSIVDGRLESYTLYKHTYTSIFSEFCWKQNISDKSSFRDCRTVDVSTPFHIGAALRCRRTTDNGGGAVELFLRGISRYGPPPTLVTSSRVRCFGVSGDHRKGRDRKKREQIL